ncbi:MAG: hypothetical protein IJ019_03605 [Alphaproteobacteria bacterium]|nr:hypothetical protein [Alphaproteobacteria bacterium]
MKPVKDIRDVETEIRRALIILKTMPTDGPKKLRSHWPACLNEQTDDNLMSKPLKYTKALPEEIDDMDEVLEDWLKCIDYDERNLVIMRNSGWSWKVLIDKYNVSRSHLYNRYVKCLKKILSYVLEKQQKKQKEVK